MYKKVSVLIILVASVLAVTSLWDDSFIVDEIPHVGAGYSYVTKGDFRLNPEHPPLAKDLAGFALSLLSIDQSAFSTQYWISDINGQWNFGRALIYNPANNVDAITRTAKTTMLIFFVLSAVLIYRWAKERYGQVAALIATILFSFSPTVLAHSRFITTDMPALFGVLLGTYFFVKFLQKPTFWRFGLATLAFGVAQLTKFSAILLVPLFVLMIIAWALANSYSFKASIILFIRSLLLMAVGIIIVVWPVYTLHTINYPPEKQRTDTEFHLASYGNRVFADPVVWASDKPVIRPLAYYATGILMVNQRSIGGNTTFFLGEVRNYAWKHYFPVMYAIKEPLSFWALVLIVLLTLSTQVKSLKLKVKSVRNWIKTYFVEFSMLLWLAIYWYLSIQANLNIGVRHLLPTYGFMFILLAGQLSKIIGNSKLFPFGRPPAGRETPTRSGRGADRSVGFENYKTKIKIGTILIFVLLGWYVIDTVHVHPYYLTYFNQLALLRPDWATEGQAAGIPGGGHLYAVDSNLDWGQDLKRLTMWVEENNVDKIHLDYFGWADQTYYLKDKLVWIGAGTFKDARDFLAQNPDGLPAPNGARQAGGYIAVSASFYMGSRGDPVNNYIWLDAYEPIVKIGNSIFIWEIRP